MKTLSKIWYLAKSFLAQFALISLVLEQFIFISTATAQVLSVTPDGSTNTQVTQTASGVDQINIAAPNANGTSHNKFTDYNVNAGGQVFNNFSGKNSAEIAAGSGATAVTQTQISGLVTANSNLASSGSAKLILNEVTSGNTSQLLGYAEIAGTKADLILANPNGIACHGCGFINTARLLMVAGSSNFDANGNLGFNLKEQANPKLYVPLITIDGLGLDVTRTSGTDIVASSVKLLSSIFGSDNNFLGIKTGEGSYNYATKIITENNTQNNADPVFAIDASSLAQIQAGQIYIIATKQGVGVKMESVILASQTLNLDANGDIYYKSISVGDTANLRSSGTIQSTDFNSSISAPTINIAANQFNNSGLSSAYNLNIQNSGTLNNSGNLEALNLNLSNIANINNSGSIFGQNSLAISGTNLTNNSSASIYSPVHYTIALTDLLTNLGLITSANNLTLNSNQLSNSSEISAQNNLTFSIINSASNSGNLIAGNALNFTANSFTNSGATQSNNSSTFNLSSLFNQNNAAIYSRDSLNLNVENTLKNSGELISSDALSISSPNFANFGNIIASKNLNLSASFNFFNSGNIQSSQDTTINTASFYNSGLINSLQSAAIDADEINNQSDGVISTTNDLALTSTSLSNLGLIYSGNNFTANSSSLSNSGNIYSANDFSITNSSDLSNFGNFYSDRNLAILSNNLANNSSAWIYGGKDISLASNIDLTNAGNIQAIKDLALLVGRNSNNSGVLNSSTNLNLNTTSLTNSGSLSSFGNLNISANSNISNSNQILSNGTLSITAANLSSDNLIQSNGDLSLNLVNLTSTNNILSGGAVNISASGSVSNSGILESAKSFAVSANSFSNAGSSLILAGDDLTVRASSINNQNTKPTTSAITSGMVSANGAVNLLTDALNNNSGLVVGKSTSVSALNADSVNLYNTLGAFISTAEISLNLGNIDYTIAGTVTANNIDITANNIVNQGNVTAFDFIKLNATGNSGVAGNGNITNGFASGDNSNVSLAAGSYIDLTAKNNINNYGAISATTDLSLTSTFGNINNYSTGKIAGGSGVAIISALNGAFSNNDQTSLFTANNNVIFNTKNLSNAGEISVANNLTTNITNNLSNNATALIWIGNNATFNVANAFLNNQASIYANNNLKIQKNTSLDKTNLVQNISGNIETYAGDIAIIASTMNNQRSSMKTQNYTYWQSGCNFHHHECHYDSSYTASINSTIGANSSVDSGGNVFLKIGTLNNDSASILAVENIAIDAPIINNTSHNFEAYQNYSSDWWRCCNPYGWLTTYKPANIYTESYPAYIKAGGSLTVTQNGSFNPTFVNGSNVAQYSTIGSNSNYSRSTTVGNIDSYTLAKTGAINIDLSLITNAINNNSFDTKGSILASTASASFVSASRETANSLFLAASPSNTVFSGNFKVNLDSSATTPLVESRSQFTDTSKFFGSSYYFDQLGLKGSSVLTDIDLQTRNASATRMLGDSFVETKLILDQLKTLTNDSLFLSKTTTDHNQQIKDLLDNSVNQFAALGLNAEDVAIHGLTSTQENSLTKDIITFELAKVNGISVLAPKIYLSQNTRNRLLDSDNSLATSSTLFAKTGLTIDSHLTSMTNIGSIASGGSLTLNIGSLTNSSAYFGNLSGSAIASVAKIKSVGDLTIISNNRISDISGISLKNSILDSGGKISISASNNISIANDKSFAFSSLALSSPSLFSISASSVKDDASAARSELSFNAASDIQISSGGSINVANSYFNTGGSIFMNASNNINNSNYTIKASENVVISAGNNINNIHTSANNNETRIEAGNIVSLDAGSDINNIGSTIKGGSLVYLTAGRDINNKALVNYAINGGSTNLDGSPITESQALASGARYISSNLVSQGNIESGGNLVMVAANNINIKGSNVNSTGSSSYIEATNGNINAEMAVLRDKTFAEGGSKKKHWVSINDNITNIESNVTSGGTIDLVASGRTDLESALPSEIGNINITGSKLISADNLTLAAKNDITIVSAQDATYSFNAGKLGKGKSYLNISKSTTQVESELATNNNGDISITSGVGNTDTIDSPNAHGSIALIASKLTTKDADNNSSNNAGTGSITLAAKEDLTISSAINTKYSKNHSTKKGLTVKKLSTEIDGSATNFSSEFNASGDITTISGNDTKIIASNFSSQGSGSITAAGQTNIFNGVDVATNYSNTVKERAGVLSDIPVVKEVFQVVDVVLGGLLNGITGGNWNANSVVGHSISRDDGKVATEKIVTSNLNFANNLTINSDQNLLIRSSKLTSTSDDITLTSNLGNVSITAATANNTSNWRANNKTDRSKANEERVKNSGVANASEITAGNNITITSSQGSALLQAAKLTSGTKNIVGNQDITVSATNGNIYLLAANDTFEVTHIDKSKGTYSFSNGASGQIRSAVINNEIRADGGNVGSTSGSVVFDTTNQILAQYKNIGLGNDVSVFVDDAKLSYLNSLDPTKTNFSAVNEIHANWDQTTRGLTGAAVAAIVVAAVATSCVFTACIAAPAAAAAGTGSGAAAAGASTGATAGVITATTTTTTTLASASLAEIAAVVGSAALNAGVTTAATTATISAINASMNADGDIFKQLKTIGTTSYKDTTSTESLRNIAIAATVAAAASATGEFIKNTKINYNNSITPEQAALGKKTVSTGQSNLMPGSAADSKIGTNVIQRTDLQTVELSWFKEGEKVEVSQNFAYTVGNQNPVFQGFNTTFGAPSFADFHDALNLSTPWNELSIPVAYAASQFNALTPYYPTFINYETNRK